MKSLSDALLRGVWGPHSKLGENRNYGGPDCAAEAPISFKLAVMGGLVSQLPLTPEIWLPNSVCVFQNFVVSLSDPITAVRDQSAQLRVPQTIRSPAAWR